MIPYYLVILFAILYYFKTIGTGKEYSKGFFLFFLMYLAFFVGMGDMQGGYDRYIYCDLFDETADVLRKGMTWRESAISGYQSERLYVYWNYFVAHFTENRYIFILVTTILMYLLYYKALSSQVENYPAATLVFLGLFYYFTMTYIRQSLAVGCAWWATKYIVDKKLLKFAILAVSAFFFHHSSILFLPTFFICRMNLSEKFWNVVLIIAFILGFTPFSGFLFALFGDLADADARTEDYIQDSNSSARLIYAAEALFFIWLLWNNKSKFQKDIKNRVYYNMTYMFCAILLLFIKFGQGGRITWPFMIGPIYIMTFVIDNAISRKNYFRELAITVSIILFLRVSYDWTNLLTPYKTFLTKGYPSAIMIYEKFEYDRNYTEDKLYRKPIDVVW